ncbi:MAG: biotin/lipoyl-binding protein [Comamonadaceae bacterium]|nr:biotin/lipoyl-binding protein [Comamonadaceae bacterium]
MVIVLIALVAGATALVRHRKARNEATAPAAVSPVIVSARDLHMGDVVLTRPAVAEVRALTEAVVASRFSGYVLEMPYPEGQKVKKGDVLARLDASQVEADVAKAQAELARSRQQESALSADLAAARATLDSETQRYRRLEELYKIKFVSLQQLQSGEATLAAAQARKAAADSAWNGYRDSLRAAESGLRAARENRRYAVLTAPFDGIVAGRLAQPGDLTLTGQAPVQARRRRRESAVDQSAGGTHAGRVASERSDPGVGAVARSHTPGHAPFRGARPRSHARQPGAGGGGRISRPSRIPAGRLPAGWRDRSRYGSQTASGQGPSRCAAAFCQRQRGGGQYRGRARWQPHIVRQRGCPDAACRRCPVTTGAKSLKCSDSSSTAHCCSA